MTKKPTSDEILGICLLLLASSVMLLLAVATRFVSFHTTAAIGSILLAVFAVFMAKARQQLIFLGFALPFGSILIALANNLSPRFQPHTVDAFLSRLDGGLSVAIYHWTLHQPGIYRFLEVVYFILPLFTALVLALSERRMACFRASLLAGLIAPIFYFLVPAVGPDAYGLVQNAPRNCFPSLHLTWALLLVLYSRSHLRRIAVVYLVLIAASTLGLGAHYIVDLVAAIPYTMGIYWLEGRLSRYLPPIDSTTVQAADPAPLPEEAMAEEVEEVEVG